MLLLFIRYGPESDQLTNEGDALSLEQDSLEPPAAMGNVQSCHSQQQQQQQQHIDEFDTFTKLNETFNVSMLQRLAADDSNVPYVDDESWQTTEVQESSETVVDEEEEEADEYGQQQQQQQEVEDEDEEEEGNGAPYDDAVHFYADGHYCHEMPGIPAVETLGYDQVQLFPGESELRKRPVTVRFSTSAIKGTETKTPLVDLLLLVLVLLSARIKLAIIMTIGLSIEQFTARTLSTSTTVATKTSTQWPHRPNTN